LVTVAVRLKAVEPLLVILFFVKLVIIGS